MSESLADALTIRYYLDIFDGDEHVVTSDGLNLFLKKLSAREIIDLDNRLGGNQVYTSVSRWVLMENLVRHAIDTKSLTRLLSILFDKIDSNNLDVKSYSENKMYAVESMIRAINVDLSKKGFELIITDGNEVTVRDVRGVVISFEVTIQDLSHWTFVIICFSSKSMNLRCEGSPHHDGVHRCHLRMNRTRL